MRRRVLVTIVAVAALSVAAFFVPAAVAIRSRIQRNDLLELQREAAIVASRVPAAGSIDLAAFADVVESGHSLAVYDRSGDLIEGDGPAQADDLVRRGVAGDFAEGTVDGDLVVVVPVRIDADGPELVIRIREPSSASQGRVSAVFVVLGLAAVAVVAVAAAVGTLLARRLSRPVEELGRWASGLGRDAHDPPPPRSGIEELDELSASLTIAGQRIDELLERERSFSSHVAHQLRTPVAAMRVAVEAELASPRPDASTVLHESIGALDRLEATITSLLALARHDRREPVPCDIAALVRDQLDRWRASFAAVGRSVSVDGSDVLGRVDPPSVRHIVDVLADNALHHGRGAVTVTVRRVADRVEVDVADEGSLRAGSDLFSESRRAASHGIGLRLARTLAESAGGSLAVVEAPTTVFRLTLPAGDDGAR